MTCELYGRDDLVRYQRGELSNKEAMVLELHMQECSICRGEYVKIAIKDNRMIWRYEQHTPVYIHNGETKKEAYHVDSY